MTTNDKINLRAALKASLPRRSFVRKADMLFMVGFLHGYKSIARVLDDHRKGHIKAVLK